MVHGKKILLAPLDWGLGHATRCIPLIDQLLTNNCHIIVAGTVTTNAIIQEAFPMLQFEQLDGYDIHYGANPHTMPLKMLLQLPKLLWKIRYENNWLKSKVKILKPDMIISDNRYGFRHQSYPSIFITHQLNIQVPQNSYIQYVVNRINHSFIKKFSACWIPDREDFPLAGKLSESVAGLNSQYIGWLSRFDKPLGNDPQTIDYLFLLSGPEPQRSILEERIIREGKKLVGKKVLVQGKPAEHAELQLEDFYVYSHLKTEALQQLMNQSRHIICRSGYSTLMDLVRLNKRALLIPTPGQTEQEYLAHHLLQKKIFYSISQDESIQQGLEAMKTFSYLPFPTNGDH